MRRLPRILLNAATAVSLVLCAATLILCVVSVWTCHRLTIGHCVVNDATLLMRDVYIAADGARLRLAWDRITSTDPWYIRLHGGEQGWRFSHHAEPPADLGWHALWFGMVADRIGPEARQAFVADQTTVQIPAWVLLALAAALPLRRLSKMRKAPHCLCPACGYDLRATPGRCPECGMIPAR